MLQNSSRLLSVLRRWFKLLRAIVYCCSHRLAGSLRIPGFDMQYLVSNVYSFTITSLRKRDSESWLLYFNCLPVVRWLLVVCVSSSRCHRLVWSVWLGYLMVILTSFFLLSNGPASANSAESYNSLESYVGRTWIIYFDNVTLTLHNVTLTL